MILKILTGQIAVPNALVAAALGVGVLSACTPNMASKTDLKLASFSTRVTTKKDVIGILGLPERIARSPDGTEGYFYAGDANLTGFLVMNSAKAMQFVPPSPVDEVIGNRKVGEGALYLFDRDGLLIFEDSPRTRSAKQ